jgi:hypothetical protein
MEAEEGGAGEAPDGPRDERVLVGLLQRVDAAAGRVVAGGQAQRPDLEEPPQACRHSVCEPQEACCHTGARVWRHRLDAGHEPMLLSGRRALGGR